MLTSSLQERLDALDDFDEADAAAGETPPPPVTETPVEVAQPKVSAYTWTEVEPPDPRAVAARREQLDPPVRRPTYGLVRHTPTYATLEIVVRDGSGPAGTAIEIFNSTFARRRSSSTSNFIVQGVTTQKMEAVQIVKTFGDWYIQALGDTPEALTVRGVLFESANYPWLTEWKRNWDTYLRAKQCLLRRAMAYLTIDKTMYVGYLVSSSTVRDVNAAWEVVPFNFSLLIRDTVDLRADALFPDSAAGENRAQPGTEENPVPELAAFYGEPDSLPSLLEIVSGGAEYTRNLSEPVLEAGTSKDAAMLRVNVSALLQVARAINAAAGREVLDLQRVRTTYLNQRLSEFENMGITDPAILAQYGFPSRYQLEVDARRARLHEQQRDALSSAFDAAKSAASALKWG